MSTEVQIPAGKGQGKVPISQATDGQLKGFIRWQSENLKKDPNSQYAASNKKQLDAAKAELDRRAKGGQRAPSATEAQSQAIERAQSASLSTPGPSSSTSLEQLTGDPAVITARFAQLSKDFHLVSPVTSVDVLPEGTGVSVSYVRVDPETDTYAVGNGSNAKLALSGDTLNRIAAAAGISWDPTQSGRLDDGSDANYVHYRSVGVVRAFDGSPRTIIGEKEVDLRDGSPQVDEIIEKAKNAKDRNGNAAPRDPAIQLREARKFILALAESKARNRAIASMGVRRSYKREELERPFAVCRLCFTGATDDPVLRREFALQTQRSMQGAVGLLYGGQAPTPRRVESQPLPEFRGHAPPPIGEDDDDFVPGESDFLEAEGAELTQPEQQSPQQAAPKSEQPSAPKEG